MNTHNARIEWWLDVLGFQICPVDCREEGMLLDLIGIFDCSESLSLILLQELYQCHN